MKIETYFQIVGFILGYLVFIPIIGLEDGFIIGSLIGTTNWIFFHKIKELNEKKTGGENE